MTEEKQRQFKDVSPEPATGGLRAPAARGNPDGTTDKPADVGSGKGAGPETRRQKEIGGPDGPEPTRYGDWAFKGRVTDF